MKEDRKELKSGIWFTVCNIIQKAVIMISIPLFTRLMSTDDYGMTSVYQAWNSVLLVIVTMNFSQGVFNNGMVRYKEKRSEFVSSIQLLSTLIGMIYLLLVCIFRNSLARVMGLSKNVVLVMFFSFLFVPAYDYWCARKRFEYKYKSLIVTTITYALISIIVPVFAIEKVENKGEIKIISSTISMILFCSIFYFANYINGKKGYVKEYWKYVFYFNLPLIPHYLAGILLAQSDRIMIGNMIGKEEAGIYSVAASLQGVIGVVVNAINSALVPWLYGKLQERDFKNISVRLEQLLLLLGFMTVIVISCGPEIISIIASPSYYQAIWCVTPIILGTFMNLLYLFFGNIEIFFEKRVFMTVATVGTAVINIILNMICIPLWGYIACAYTTFLSYVLYAMMHYLFMVRIKIAQIKLRDYQIFRVKRIIGICVVVFGFSFLQMALFKNLFLRYSVLIILCGMAMCYYNIFKKGNEYD